MFENIIGHDDVKRVLHEDLVKDKISHAYLFVGSEGIGKCSLAKEFAKEILKVDNINGSPDYKYISRKEDKKDIIVEQIRKEIIDDVYLSPVSGEKKVYIIDNAQDLNIASQNALLKTLEEPPEYVVIILVSSGSSTFLPTIISRVSKINFCPIDEKVLKDYILKEYKTEFDDKILAFVDGSLGRAIKIIKENLVEEYSKINKLYESIIKKDVISSFKNSENIKFNDDLLDYLEFLLYSNFQMLSTKFVEKAKLRLKMNGNYDIVIDNMILNIIDEM